MAKEVGSVDSCAAGRQRRQEVVHAVAVVASFCPGHVTASISIVAGIGAVAANDLHFFNPAMG